MQFGDLEWEVEPPSQGFNFFDLKAQLYDPHYTLNSGNSIVKEYNEPRLVCTSCGSKQSIPIR